MSFWHFCGICNYICHEHSLFTVWLMSNTDATHLYMLCIRVSKTLFGMWILSIKNRGNSIVKHFWKLRKIAHHKNFTFMLYILCFHGLFSTTRAFFPVSAVMLYSVGFFIGQSMFWVMKIMKLLPFDIGIWNV